ncbi:UPF0721 transmembrane protein [Clostridia bacterium]|nr:UPF0721 transmembrane protein [Clostridia bacterium]
MDFSLWLPYLIACPLCALAGFIDSIAGGGGLISLPAYYLVKFPARLAAGTNKVSSSLGAITAVIKYARNGSILWVPALLSTLGALPGAYFGARALMAIDERLAIRAMLFVLPAVALIVLFRRGKVQRDVKLGWVKYPIFMLIGLVVGFYDGMVGPGSGTFLIMLFCGITGMEPLMASGTAKVTNLASGLSSLVGYMLSGYANFPLGIAAGIFSMGGNLLGAGLAIKKGAKIIQAVLMIVLGLIFITLIIEHFAA